MPATVNGVDIFGLIVSMNTGDDRRELQRNSYFGLSGVETVNGGGRGRITEVVGVFIADNFDDCVAMVEAFRGYRNGVNYTLIDNAGVTWGQVRLEAFNPAGRYNTDGVTGQVLKNYAATFEHAI